MNARIATCNLFTVTFSHLLPFALYYCWCYFIGFVHFAHHESALRAIRELNGFVPFNAAIDPQTGRPRPLMCKFANEKNFAFQHGNDRKDGANGHRHHGSNANSHHSAHSHSRSAAHANGSANSFAHSSPADQEHVSNVYVAGLPKHFLQSNIEQLFSPFGKILQTKLLSEPGSGQSRGIAFVRFERRADAARAIQEVDGTTIEGAELPIQVRWAIERPSPSMIGGGMTGGGGGGGRRHGHGHAGMQGGHGGPQAGGAYFGQSFPYPPMPHMMMPQPPFPGFGQHPPEMYAIPINGGFIHQPGFIPFEGAPPMMVPPGGGPTPMQYGQFPMPPSVYPFDGSMPPMMPGYFFPHQPQPPQPTPGFPAPQISNAPITPPPTNSTQPAAVASPPSASTTAPATTASISTSTGPNTPKANSTNAHTAPHAVPSQQTSPAQGAMIPPTHLLPPHAYPFHPPAMPIYYGYPPMMMPHAYPPPPLPPAAVPQPVSVPPSTAQSSQPSPSTSSTSASSSNESTSDTTTTTTPAAATSQ